MKDLGFFLGMFAILIILAITVGENQDRAPQSSSAGVRNEEVRPRNTSSYVSQSEGTQTNTPQVRPELSPRETEEKVAAIYRELDTLREDLRKIRLSEPASPYRNLVRLSLGNVYGTKPEDEYLTLRAESSNGTGVNISGWYLESYVTEESAAIPKGDRTMERWRSPNEESIVLLPGETAYLTSGDSPIDTSFRENMCTGYLAEEGRFTPSLFQNCPRPQDELKRFGNRIDLDDDECYEFIERLSSCTVPLEETYTRSKVGSACSILIENTFNYTDCVRLHRYDPFFSRDGYWRIYLGERTELWRSEREIIRLMDELDRVIAVIEY